jgi:hypothetical protein
MTMTLQHSAMKMVQLSTNEIVKQLNKDCQGSTLHKRELHLPNNTCCLKSAQLCVSNICYNLLFQFHTLETASESSFGGGGGSVSETRLPVVWQLSLLSPML